MSYNLFVYGTLIADDVFNRVLKFRCNLDGELAGITKRPCSIKGYKRVKVCGEVYPALTKGDEFDSVGGLLISGLTLQQLLILDEFEGSEYSRAVLNNNPGLFQGSSEDPKLAKDQEALTYLWSGAPSRLSVELWDFDHFVRAKLKTWLLDPTEFKD